MTADHGERLEVNSTLTRRFVISKALKLRSRAACAPRPYHRPSCILHDPKDQKDEPSTGPVWQNVRGRCTPFAISVNSIPSSACVYPTAAHPYRVPRLGDRIP